MRPLVCAGSAGLLPPLDQTIASGSLSSELTRKLAAAEQDQEEEEADDDIDEEEHGVGHRGSFEGVVEEGERF